MDDSIFDGYIRRKMEDYEPPDAVPGPFPKFQTAYADRPRSWYIRYRTETLIAASVLLFILFSIYFPAKIELDESHSQLLARPEKVIDSLKTVIRDLKNRTEGAIYVPDSNNKRTDRIADSTPLGPGIRVTGSMQNPEVRLPIEVADLPQDVFRKLKAWNLLEWDGERAWLIVSPRRNEATMVARTTEGTVADPVTLHRLLPPILTVKLDPPASSSKSRNQISGKTRNAIEKHYFSGVGINLAPHADLVSGSFSSGSGRVVPRIGLIADWVLSPKISVETGVDYAALKFAVSNNFQKLGLPNVDTELGTLQSAQISARTASLPVNFKYRRWITAESQLIFRVGYTPYFSLRGQYIYNYRPPNLPPGSDVTINTIEQVDDNKFYGNTISASAGVTRALRENRKLEASLFFEHSLGTVGTEKAKMNMVGVKTAYWFNVR